MSNLQKSDQAGLPPWVLALREAAQKHVKATDIEEIVKKQVDLAKQGNKDAIKFVFDYVLGGNSMKGATFVQNNYGPEPERPAAGGKIGAPGGSKTGAGVFADGRQVR